MVSIALGVLALLPACRRLGHEYREDHQPVRHRGLAGARTVRALVTLSYAFEGGSSQDDAEKSGAANLAADMLDEGAAISTAIHFTRRLENSCDRTRLSRRHATISAVPCVR